MKRFVSLLLLPALLSGCGAKNKKSNDFDANMRELVKVMEEINTKNRNAQANSTRYRDNRAIAAFQQQEHLRQQMESQNQMMIQQQQLQHQIQMQNQINHQNMQMQQQHMHTHHQMFGQ